MSAAAASSAAEDYPQQPHDALRGRHRTNFYTLLGVSPSATDAEIRRAFRALSVVFHPDRTVNQPPEVVKLMSQRFILINEAYQTLSDPVRRAAYDALGTKGVKELSLIPAEAQNQYDAATLVRLLRVADEEKALLKTAVRVGSTSSIDMSFNGHILANAAAAMGNDWITVMRTWIEDDPETEWTVPGGEVREKKRKRPNQEQQDEEEQQQEQSVSIMEEPKPPAQMSFSCEAPAVVMVQVNGKNTFALIPVDTEQELIKQRVEQRQKEEQEYNAKKEQFEKQQKRLKLKEQGDEEQQEQQVVYGPPPLPILWFHFARTWAPRIATSFRQATTPYRMAGRYAFQLPIGSNTVSLFSVSGSKEGKQSQFKAEIDAETKHYFSSSHGGASSGGAGGKAGAVSTLTWLWSVSLSNVGTKLVVGFQKALSAIWTAKLKLTAWAEDGSLLPQLYFSFTRKLTEASSIVTSYRLPGPWSSGDRFGNCSIFMNGPSDGFGMMVGVGTLQLTYARQRPFCFFPFKSSAATSTTVAAKQSSALSFLRRFDTTVEKSLEVHLSADPVLRHEDTFYFTRSLDPSPMAEQAAAENKKRRQRRRRRQQHQQKQRQQQQSQDEKKHSDNDDDEDNQGDDDDDDAADLLFTDADDDDSVDDADNNNDENAEDIANEQQQQHAHSHHHHQNRGSSFAHRYKEQREKDEIHTVAAPLLRHSFGISISTAWPLLYVFFPSLRPANRGFNTAISLVYKRGEHKINLPIRVNFSPSFVASLFIAGAPYVLNAVFSSVIAKYSDRKLKQKSVERRIRGEMRVRREAHRAKVEQEGMAATVRGRVLEETRANGLVILNAQYGVLHPVLEYPETFKTRHELEAERGDGAAAAAAASTSSSANLPPSTLVCDCTVAIQNLVRDSKVHIAGGSPKHMLAGIYDPHPWIAHGIERKELKIVYRFRGRMHEVVVGDTEELRMPLVEHLVRV